MSFNMWLQRPVVHITFVAIALCVPRGRNTIWRRVPVCCALWAVFHLMRLWEFVNHVQRDQFAEARAVRSVRCVGVGWKPLTGSTVISVLRGGFLLRIRRASSARKTCRS